jgi:hypothetical protein
MKNFKFFKAKQEFTYDDVLAAEALAFVNNYMRTEGRVTCRLCSVIGEFSVVEKRFHHGLLSYMVVELKPADRNMVILYTINPGIARPFVTNIETIDYDVL